MIEDILPVHLVAIGKLVFYFTAIIDKSIALRQSKTLLLETHPVT